jgi:hypothetical protein
MARQRYDRASGQWVDIEQWGALQASRRGESRRSDIAAPMVLSDCMDALRHPVTGLYSDSKAAFRAMTRASGCEEVGDQAPTENNNPDLFGSKAAKAERVADIKHAMGKL